MLAKTQDSTRPRALSMARSMTPGSFHCGKIPMRARARQGWAAQRRQAAAMFVSPTTRSSPIAVVRNAAMTSGLAPQRTCERSSSKVTARTQGDWFSLRQ